MQNAVGRVYNTGMNAKNIITFAKEVNKSKRIKRTGWLLESIANPESVAEHSFRLVVLAMVLAEYLEVDTEKLVKMAIIHDLGETITGDLVVERGRKVNEKYKKEKEKLEEKGIGTMFKKFDKKYKIIFHEMIARETKEAKIFWQLDKLEMAMQAKEYEEKQNKNLPEFFENANMHITDPLLKKVMKELNK